jgi:hypothetical protein
VAEWRIKWRLHLSRNYYFFDAEPESLNRLIAMLEHVKKIMAELPDRSGVE